MISYSNEQLTVLLSVRIGAALENQDISVFVIPVSKTQVPALFIRVNQPPIPQYKGESSIYGKILRLIYHLHLECRISSMLKMYELSYLVLTEAKSPNLVNQTNTYRVLTEHVKGVCDTLDSMTPSQNEEYIGHMVRMNNEQFGL